MASPTVTVTPDVKEEGPKRNLQIIPPFLRDSVFTVAWSNCSLFSARPLIYVLTLIDTEIGPEDELDLFGENMIEDDHDL